MFKLTLWYEKPDLSNGIAQEDHDYGPVYMQQILPYKFKQYSIPFEKKIINQDVINKNSFNCFIIEIKYLKEFQGSLSNLAADVLNFLKKYNVKIVFHYAKEGYSLDQDLEYLYRELNLAGLINCKTFLIFGDQDIEENYKKAIKKNNLPDFLTKVFPINYFESHYLDTLNDLNENYKRLLPISKEKEKDFLFYNGKIRIHRLLAHKEITERNLDKFGLISFIGDTHVKTEHSMKFYKKQLQSLNILDNYMQDYLDNWKPIFLDKKGSEFTYHNQNATEVEHYTKTHLSLVSEMSVTTRFLTEKIYKPILNSHPFLILGGKGVLATLQSMGYYTYPEIFNEDYDNEPNPKLRVLKVIDELQKFCNLSSSDKESKVKQVMHKVDYNKNHFIERAKNSLRDQYLQIFKRIYES